MSTVHGSSLEDIRHKGEMEKILKLKLIDRFVVLSADENMDRYFEIYDKEGNTICGKSLLRAPA